MQNIKTIFILVMLCLSTQMIGQPKQALIIGNDDYVEFADLRFSIKESNELKRTLLEMGYEVTLVMNANRIQMLEVLDDFFRKDASISLFYYSGHTYKSEHSEDVYLVPIDARIENQFVVEIDLIPIKRVGNFSSNSAAKQKILIFDVVDDFESGEIQEEVQLAASANHNRNDDIILSNNNLQNSPGETSHLLKCFLDELRKPEQTIRGTFDTILKKSSLNRWLNVSLFLGGFNPDLLWSGKEPGMSAIDIMPSFPFPPPKASASCILDKEHFVDTENLFEVGEILNNTLKSCGYLERSYYQIPEGFALVTRIEKIEPDARPCPVPDRWNAPHNKVYENFSIKDYFRSLFTAKKGKYRIIVFFVTSIPFNQSESQMSIVGAEKYLKNGYNSLPIEFKSIPYTSDYNCTALIYEFDKVEYEEGVQVESSKFLGHEHLNRNNFLPILIKRKK